MLAALAGAQCGVFSVVQAVAAGVSPAMLSRRVASQRLFRLHRGIYSLVSPRLLGENGRRMAAVLAAGPGAGLSHISAAIHTGFLHGTAPRLLDVTVPRRGGHQRPGLRIHRSATLRAADIERVYGIPTTTVARTLLDLAAVLSPDKLQDAMDEAGRMELLDVGALVEQVTVNSGRPEAARLKHVVDTWELIWSFTESQLEKLLLRGLDAAGLARPELQVWLDLGDGRPRIRADFLFRDARLILEADGWRWHAHRFERDAQRDQRAAVAGFQTLRVTRRQVVTDLDRVTATVAAVHAQRQTLLAR